MLVVRFAVLALGLAFGLALSCAPLARDSVRPAICRHDPAALPELDEATLAEAVKAASHVVRGRIRFTGEALNQDGRSQQRYIYVIVDALEFLKGDPWQLPGRYGKSFPILALDEGRSDNPHFNLEPGQRAVASALMCREDEALWFVVDLPDVQRRPPHEMPDPVVRSFGPLDVRLHAVVQEVQRDQLVRALSR